MPELNIAEDIVVGFRQSMRLLEENNVRTAIVAKDADEHVRVPIVELCQQKGVEVVWADSKKELGRVCKLDVSAAVAVVMK